MGVSLLVAGIFLAAYGLFAILYGGDSGGSGNTYVKFGGHEMDARLVGAIALLVSFVVLLCGGLLVKRGRHSSKSS